MRINRIRNFKKTVEVTLTLTADDCEDLSHIVSVQEMLKPEDLGGYPEKKQRGIAMLKELNNKVFWTHWDSNFLSKRFEPEGKM